MSFTFFHAIRKQGNKAEVREYLYECLKEQTIWKSLRFWTAAFFDAVQNERTKTCGNGPSRTLQESLDLQETHENISFGQLGTFTHNMHAFGLTKQFCLEFLRKQSTIANLSSDQIILLRENIEMMYRDNEDNKRRCSS